MKVLSRRWMRLQEPRQLGCHLCGGGCGLSRALEGQIGVRLASWQLDEGRGGVVAKGGPAWRLAEGHRLSFHSACPPKRCIC